MNTVLMVAAVLITIAVIAQAVVLIGMYLVSRRISVKAETLIDDSRRIMAPVESITRNLKTVSHDLAEAGRIAREQALHLQEFTRETRNTIRGELAEVRARVLTTVDEARTTVMRPVREYSAIAAGIAEGLRTLFFGRRQDEIVLKEDHPAA